MKKILLFIFIGLLSLSFVSAVSRTQLKIDN